MQEDDLTARGEALFAAGDLAGAVRSFLAAWDDGADEADACRRIAHCLLAAGLFDPAERLLERAVEARPGSAVLHTELGQTRMRAERPGAAHDSFDTALALEPGSALLHLERGTAAASLGREAQARADMLRALQLAPQLADKLGQRGTLPRVRAMITAAVKLRSESEDRE